MKNKTPSYPPVRGRLDTFSACVPSSREVSVSGLPLQGDKRGSIYLLRFPIVTRLLAKA